MLGQEDLVYVDKQYKQDMEMFEAIKTMSHRVIVDNTPFATMVYDWKTSIRKVLHSIKK